MIDIRFAWSKARGYEWVDVKGAKILRPLGDRRYPVEPFKIEGDDPLYIRFAELDLTEVSCLSFANAYGPLTKELPDKAETLGGWRREIRKIKGMMSALQAGEKLPGGILRMKPGSRGVDVKMTSINVVLVPGKFNKDGMIGRPMMLLEPENLLDAMYLQLGKFVAGDGVLRACKQCERWFESGATESRRSIAIFCSEKCKNRFHYLERAKR